MDFASRARVMRVYFHRSKEGVLASTFFMSLVSRLELTPEWQHSLTLWEYQDFDVVGFAFVSIYVEVDCNRTKFDDQKMCQSSIKNH